MTSRSSTRPTSPRHVSVLYHGRWDEEVAERFDGCFDEPGTNNHPSPYWQPVRGRALETATELIKAVERRLEGLRTTAS